MKVEFIKEEKIGGYSIYYTNVDDKFVDGSLSLDEEKARKMYNHLVKNPSGNSIITVLESVEKEENPLKSEEINVNL